MATTILLKLHDKDSSHPAIQGDSKIVNHHGWIELISLTPGGSRHSPIGSGTLAPTTGEFTVAKWSDKSTANLFVAGNRAPYLDAEVDYLEGDGKKGLPYFTMKLKNVSLQNFGYSGEQKNGNLYETFSMTAANVAYEYKGAPK